MWFPLSLVALSMLVARRSVEKSLSSKIDSLAMAWLQQAFAIPFILLTLFFAKFYMPGDLSASFWGWMFVYVVCCAIDTYCYFKALSLADVSYVAPLLSLVAVGNIIGAYFVLGQVPSWHGFVGAFLVVTGAYVIHRTKHAHPKKIAAHKTALILILTLVVVRSFFSNIEVFMLREANPTTFNFYSSLLMIPVLIATSLIIIRRKKLTNYWGKVAADAKRWQLLLLFVGLTYTINMLATYQAKLISPDAGYVGAVKSAQVLPMMLVGVFLFREKVGRIQWVAAGIIVTGLYALGTN